jgi:uncharacterized protein DUF1570
MTRRPNRTIIYVLLGLMLLAGCASLQTQPAALDLPPLPSKKQLRVAQYLFISDNEVKREHPLFKELEGLQDRVCKELQLPAGNGIIYVYLFADRARYDQYMQAHFKNLPSRRAFFMARTDERRGDELMVYTYWGDKIAEDLRHELTHAHLHSVLKNVPMWLDEGLAEFFEVPASWNGLNYQNLSGLRTQPGTPWTPSLNRLERITLVKDMTPADYRESWAWVHLMLRGSPQAKAVLLAYLQQFRTTKDPGPLEPLIEPVFPSPEAALKQHVAHLEAITRLFPTTP